MIGVGAVVAAGVATADGVLAANDRGGTVGVASGASDGAGAG